MIDDLMAGISTPANEELLEPELLRKLDQLALALTRVFAGRRHGERRSAHRGSSVEFADYRDYSHGDDLRRVDWNVYARLERLFLKLYVEEEDLHVHLLLDTSRSMEFGAPQKLRVARRICAALGYITLANFDTLSIASVSDHLGARLRHLNGKGHISTLFSWLPTQRAEGQTHFPRVMREYALLARTPGLIIIVSDFLADGLEEGIRILVGRKFAPVLLQVLSPEEISPDLTGDLRLVDAETGDFREVSVTPHLLAGYRQRFVAHQRFLTDLSNRYGMPYIQTCTTDSFEQLILRMLRQKGVVK